MDEMNRSANIGSDEEDYELGDDQFNLEMVEDTEDEECIIYKHQYNSLRLMEVRVTLLNYDHSLGTDLFQHLVCS